MRGEVSRLLWRDDLGGERQGKAMGALIKCDNNSNLPGEQSRRGLAVQCCLAAGVCMQASKQSSVFRVTFCRTDGFAR